MILLELDGVGGGGCADGTVVRLVLFWIEIGEARREVLLVRMEEGVRREVELDCVGSRV